MISHCLICQKKFEKEADSIKNLRYVPNLCGRECFLEYCRKESRIFLAPGNYEGIHYNKIPSEFRSNYEKGLARFLKDCKISYIVERYALDLKKGFYVPDFYLPKSKTFIEVKGLWENKAFTKMVEALDKYEEIGFMLMDKTTFNRFGISTKRRTNTDGEVS